MDSRVGLIRVLLRLLPSYVATATDRPLQNTTKQRRSNDEGSDGRKPTEPMTGDQPIWRHPYPIGALSTTGGDSLIKKNILHPLDLVEQKSCKDTSP